MQNAAKRAWTVCAGAALFLAWPAAAIAQDPDEKPTPLGPREAAAQLRTFEFIAAIVVIGAIWYALRVRQIRRSGTAVDGEGRSIN